METKRAKIFIVDDYPATVEFLRLLIGLQPDLQVCGDAANAEQALKFLSIFPADLILLDISLSDRHGLELLKDIRIAYPETRVLMFSIHDEEVFAERALEAGAHGYLTKNARSDTWLEAMRRVVAGYTYLSPAMMSRISQRQGDKSSKAHGLNQLSDRELEVLQLLGQGRSVGQISAILSLGRHTVETYQTRIKHKLGLANSHEMIRYAVTWCVTQTAPNPENIQPSLDGDAPSST